MEGVTLEEKIRRFLSVCSGSGSGYGYGYGSGYGSGDGSGDGSGYGSGDGSGYGSGYGLKSFNGDAVNYIDSVPTVIRSLHLNLAKGYIIGSDMTTEDCYVVKGENLFAHGKTVKEAQEALREKIFDNMDDDEKIEAFRSEFPNADKKYPAKVFYDWHHRLTGSCKMGRDAFCRDHGIDLENGTYSVREFVGLCRDSYGGEIIMKIIDE